MSVGLMRFRQALFVCACIALVSGEGVVLFVPRTIRLAIEGASPIVVDAFGDRATVEHGFLMVGDGLSGVSVRFSAARPMRIRVLSVLSASAADEPVADAHREIYRWISAVELEPGATWTRFDFPAVPGSADRFYTFQIRLIDGVLLDESDATKPRERLPVAVMASQDNPPRGGVLWINGMRQTGSLYLRAHAPGETPYDRFRLSVELRLPPLLRNREVQICTALLYQLALCVFAYALIFGDRSDARGQS
jgi:hypothetical protein